MPLLVCQNCGFHQNDGTICRSCSTPFFYHQSTPADAAVNRPELSRPEPKTSGNIFRRAFRIVNNVSLAILIIVIVLILHKPRAPQVNVDPQAAQRAESKIEASESASASGRPEPLHLDSSEVNSLLHKDLALAPSQPPAPDAAVGNPPQSPPPPVAPPATEPTIQEVQSSVKDVKVTMHDDQVEAYVVFNFHGEDVSLDLEGKLGVNDGLIQFQPTHGTLGSLPVPQAALDDAVQKMMASPENREQLKVPQNVRDMRVENGELVVDYK